MQFDFRFEKALKQLSGGQGRLDDMEVDVRIDGFNDEVVDHASLTVKLMRLRRIPASPSKMSCPAFVRFDTLEGWFRLTLKVSCTLETFTGYIRASRPIWSYA